MPIFGSFGSGSIRRYGVFGAAKANAIAAVTATDFGTGRAYNNGRIDLSWTAPGSNGAPITGYKIERSTDNVTYTTVSANTGSTATTYSDTGLNSAQIYYYKVSAINAVGVANASPAGSATATTVPQAPTIGTVTATGQATATVTYTAGATGGKSITTFTATSNPSNFTASAASGNISATGLARQQAYTFTVTATNANGVSASSSASSSVTTLNLNLDDTFNRGNGALGTASDGYGSWAVQRGNFTVDSSRAYSSDANNSLATVALSATNLTNGQVDMVSDQGGMGIALWTTDANSYWSVYPYYTTTTNTIVSPITNSSTSTGCVGPGTGQTFSSDGSPPSGACNWNCTGPFNVYTTASWNPTYPGDFCCTRTNCSVSANQANILNGTYGPDQWYISACTGGTCTVNATNATVTNYTTNYSTNYATNYTSQIRINNNAGVQHTNQYASSFNPVRSLAVSTSGNTISYTGYSAAGKGGSTIVNSSFNAGTPTKGTRVGVFKTTSPYNQGSYVDNLSITVA